MAGPRPIIYLTAGEVLEFNREILRRAGQSSALLRDHALLEGAVQLLALATLCFTFLGLTIGNLAQNEGQAAMLNNIVTVPMVFGSEALYSLGGAPAWLKQLSQALPLEHLIDGIRVAMTGDAGGIVAPCLLLGGFTALTFLLSVLTFRWDPDAAG